MESSNLADNTYCLISYDHAGGSAVADKSDAFQTYWVCDVTGCNITEQSDISHKLIKALVLFIMI